MTALNPATLTALAVFPQLLREHFEAVPPEYRHWAPPSWEGVPSEPLTALEQLCHVRDIEVEGYQLRFVRTLREDRPLLASLDTETLAHEREYGRADAHEVLAAFAEARAGTVRMLAGLAPAQLARRAEFEGYGPVSLRALVHFLCSHDQQHLAGLQWLIGKVEGLDG